MNFVEVLIGIFVMSLIIVGGAASLLLKFSDINSFINNYEKISEKISLIQYSNNLLDECLSGCEGYLYFDKNKILVNNTIGYKFNCISKEIKKIGYVDLLSGKKIIFCKIYFDKNEILYNYKIIE